MKNGLRVIDLPSGIGGRSLGFQRAGYDIVCAIDKSNIYEDVYTKIIRNGSSIQKDITNIDIYNLPEADVIAAKLVMYSYWKRRAYLDSGRIMQNDIILKIIAHQMPKAFVLEVPSVMITQNRSVEFKSLLEAEVFRGYYITYRIIEEKEFSGFPVKGRQAFVIGIRTDLYYDEFYIPHGEVVERHIFQEAENEINKWYRKVPFDVNIKLDKKIFM